ncbi:MAG: glycosyltransferase family 4 protein [Clostridia bacterium]|nr:glycosyltransferase family 4 protein [Clostridia bacterium]
MKIIINGLQLNNENSGIGKMLLEIVNKLSKTHDITVIVPKGIELDNINTIEIPYKNSQKIRRSVYQSFLLGKKYCENAILITTDSKIPLIIPKTTVVLPIITDLALFKMPESYAFFQRILWKMQYKVLLKHCKKYIAISNSTKKDMIDILKINDSDIKVIYCAANDDIQNIEGACDDLPKKYMFFIGNMNPRKNILKIYEAYKKAKLALNLPHKLVIAGPIGWRYKKILRKLKNDSEVILKGYVTEEEKVALYKNADIFLFPTLYEGFGIPILEAQALGIPVITSNNSSMPEVAGDGAILVNPNDVEEITSAIEKLVDDEKLRQELMKKGYENVKRFSWEKVAIEIGEIIKEEQ